MKGRNKKNTKDIEGAELACLSSLESDTVYRLFRKDGHVWVRVWVHYRAKIFEGLKEASNYRIQPDQFCNVLLRGKTLKSIVEGKLSEIDSS